MRAAVLVALFIGTTAHAQTATIAGTVRDSAGAPIVDADVLVLDGPSARTNAVAAFRLDGVTAGDRRVVVRRLGFAPVDTTIRVPAGARVRLDVILRLMAPTLDTVRVAAKCPPLGLQGFRCRRESGARGVFLDTDSVDAHYDGYLGTGDLFRDRTGFRIHVTRTGVRRPVFTGGCLVELVNGRPRTRANPVPYDLREVIAVEFYERYSDVPPYYQQWAWDGPAPCGLLLYWSQIRPRR